MVDDWWARAAIYSSTPPSARASFVSFVGMSVDFEGEVDTSKLYRFLHAPKCPSNSAPSHFKVPDKALLAEDNCARYKAANLFSHVHFLSYVVQCMDTLVMKARTDLSFVNHLTALAAMSKGMSFIDFALHHSYNETVEKAIVMCFQIHQQTAAKFQWPAL